MLNEGNAGDKNRSLSRGFTALFEGYYHCDTLRSWVHRFPHDTWHTTKRWRRVGLPVLGSVQNDPPWELRHVTCQLFANRCSGTTNRACIINNALTASPHDVHMLPSKFMHINSNFPFSHIKTNTEIYQQNNKANKFTLLHFNTITVAEDTGGC